ncbi:hypothetical protein BMF94_5588 [Rhodotorula taiwanensis]|uniref:Calpain catalytic domain-containing protein n=1 Tax=Rhodotorula taiwanensis TaxID=741276 RepID=A0A2S5B3E5_9BASI|nr:hypothetical protein BMF94_5588 [Rhodotorula taiwanensis]
MAAATRATKQELAGTYDAAFASYVAAAQTYLFLIRHTVDPETKQRMRTLSAKLVERAERIKRAKKVDQAPVLRDDFVIEQQDAVLANGASFNRLRLERWSERDGGHTVTRSPLPPPNLSRTQIENGCTWTSASKVFPQACIAAETPVESNQGAYIAQDNVSDCSLVTALVVAAEHHRKFGSRLGLSSLFPQDKNGLPTRAENGQYRARLLMNGTWRCLKLAAIDDRIPVDRSGHPICAASRNGKELWPTLLEKAYLTAMGGYDFAGSNAADDLHILAGWIPEHISLRQSLRSEHTWDRVKKGFWMGKCVLTVGTGKSVPQTSELALIPSHSYAVIDLKEDVDGHRQLVLINPWRSGDEQGIWTADMRAALDLGGEGTPSAEHTASAQLMSVDWETLPVYFEALHVSWDPSIFDHTDTVHLSVASSGAAEGTVKAGSSWTRHARRVRLQVEADDSPTQVWLLLSRHSSRSGMKDEYISVYVQNPGQAEASTSTMAPSSEKSSMTDAPSELYRFLPERGRSVYDVTIAHEGQSAVFAFTLVVMSNHRVKLLEGPPPLQHSQEIEGSWTTPTSGGNHTCPSFYRNPQYSIRLLASPTTPSANSRLEIDATTDNGTPINLRLVYSDGERVDRLTGRDVLAGKSTYSYGRDSLVREGLAVGKYTLLVSSYQPDVLGNFKVSVRSSLPLSVSAIPQEGAGMFSRRIEGEWSPATDRGGGKPRFRLLVSGHAEVKIRLQASEGQHAVSVSVHKWGTAGEVGDVVATSDSPVDHPCGALIRSVRIPSTERGYVIVPSLPRQVGTVPFQLFVYADARFEVMEM